MLKVLAQRIFAALPQDTAGLTTESDVADAVWRAATDATGQLRFPAGADAVALAQVTARQLHAGTVEAQ